MNAQMTPKDWQILSEYLDGQLSPHDQTKLEQRMQTRPELRDGLEELRRLRSVLRSVPRRKAPRNFTLTRAMVEKPAPVSRFLSWVPALSLSSAMAAFLLIVTLLTGMPGGAVPASVSPEAAPGAEMEASRVMLAEPEMAADSMQGAGEAAPIIVWGGPSSYGVVDGRGGMGGGGAPDVYMGMGSADPAAEIKMAPDEFFVDEGMPPPEEMPVEPPMPEMAAPAAEQEAPATLMAAPEMAAPDLSVEPLTGAGPILGVAPVDEQGSMQLKSSAPVLEAAVEEQQEAAPTFPWLAVQIALVVIAAATGIAALYLRRKAKA